MNVQDPTIPDRIESLLKSGHINSWENNFLNSIKNGYEKYKSLTPGQNNTLLAIEARYDSAAIAQREAWYASWNEEKANNFKTMMEYYSRSQYYKGAVDKWKANPDYIPHEKEYKAICENKYSQRYLKNVKIPPKFKDGQLIVYKQYGSYYLATIIEAEEVSDWSKGSRTYKIMIVGEADIKRVMEKEMIYYRESLISKLTKVTEDHMPF